MCHYRIEVWHFKLALGPGAFYYDTWFNSKLVTILEGYGLVFHSLFWIRGKHMSLCMCMALNRSNIF